MVLHLGRRIRRAQSEDLDATRVVMRRFGPGRCVVVSPAPAGSGPATHHGLRAGALVVDQVVVLDEMTDDA